MPPLPQNGTSSTPVGPRIASAPNPTPTPQVNTALDPQLVTLAKAIRQTESQGNFQAVGKSGEYGAYQFMPSTWAATAPKFGINVPLQQATPEQQNEVAYKQLEEWRQEHPDWNIGNFASAWNAGPGKPNAYLEGNAGTNAYGAKFDTAAYAQSVAQHYQQFKLQTVGNPADQVQTPQAPQTTPQAPSLGGFAQNVVQSGANLLGGVGEAILHPIQTVQNIGGAAVGGLEKVGGQTNENTQKFDNVVNFFKNRYGSVQNLEKTLYEDPVGVAADLSTILGLGGGALKLAGNASKIDELANAGRTLSKASDLTNPLAPVAAAGGALVNPLKEGAIKAIGGAAKLEDNTISQARAGTLTPETIANITRESVGTEIADAMKKRFALHDETGSAYKPFREANIEIPVSHNFFEEQLRKEAGLEVKDGKIMSSPGAAIRASELPKLQTVFNEFKPAFQSGKLTPNEFLNFRKALGDVAYNDLGKKNTDVARVTDNIRHNLNNEYRDTIPGLKEHDLKFSTEEKDIRELQKGIFTKDGKLTDGVYNLVANATNKGNSAKLARLERIVPGITKKIEVLKAVEDMRKALTKTGTYTASILESGTILAGVSTGHLGVASAGFAAMIISRPENAVKIIQALDKIDPKLALATMARVARYATMSSVASDATSGAGTDQTGEQSQSPEGQSTPPLPSSGEASSPSGEPPQSPQGQISSQSLEELAKNKNFDVQGARDAGYSDEEIQAYLQNPQSS